MEWAVLMIVLIGLALAFIVLQGSLAARHWRRAISHGDKDALQEALDAAFDAWREQKPPAGMPPSDWQGLQSTTLIAANRDRCRVSLLADTDVRVIDNNRKEVGSALDVAHRIAVAMAERLLYEIPHVRFEQVQIDVHTQYRGSEGIQVQECLLTTQVTRSTASASDWDTETARGILRTWNTLETVSGQTLNPDDGAIIEPSVNSTEASIGDDPR